jgi:hypothetical protein
MFKGIARKLNWHENATSCFRFILKGVAACSRSESSVLVDNRLSREHEQLDEYVTVGHQAKPAEALLLRGKSNEGKNC